MPNSSTTRAWLESSSGEQFRIVGRLTVGADPECDVSIPDPTVSWRHAIIHAQNGNEFWLIDLGSTNGTKLNRRRVVRPIRLLDGNQIAIRGREFVFRQLVPPEEPVEKSLPRRTVPALARSEHWLLLGDIISFGTLSQQLPPDELAPLVGKLMRDCTQEIDQHEGTVNLYIGDAFFAYWEEGEGVRERVAAALQGLRKRQEQEPRFRVVVHHAKVTYGGMALLGEESFYDPEVNYLFRIEKVASSLKLPFILSEQAGKRLSHLMNLKAVPGTHAVKDFDGEHRFHTTAD